MTNYRYTVHRVALALVAPAAIALSACDLSVTNPGPVADGYLDSLSAAKALATGARRALADILGGSPTNGQPLVYWGAAETFEINPSGSTGSFGIPPQVQAGRLRQEDNSWSPAQRARWIAEDAIRRFKARSFPEDSTFAALNLWAGFANRLMGENFCDAVFEGGPKEDFKEFFTRAEGYFTEALRVANALTINATNKANLVNAALVARASARMYLGYYNNDNAKWTAAIADANLVPNTARWQMPFYSNDQDQYNALEYAGVNPATVYRAHTEWATYYEDYYRTTKDARVPWDSTALRGDAAVQKFAGYPTVTSSNQVWFWPQAKYKSTAAPINMTSGWEARLIEAEYELAVNSSAANAVAKMNARRANLGLPNLTVTTLDDAWTDLKRERMVELWLEARRLGDIRRWATSGTAGFGRGTGYGPATTLDGVWVTGEATPREHMGTPNGVGPTRDLCFPIGRNEIDTNPNLQTP